MPDATIMMNRTPTADPEASMKPGPAPRLNNEQLAMLHDLLLMGPKKFGFQNAGWTRGQVLEVIRGRFGVSYHLNYIPVVMQRAALAALARPSGEAFYFSDHLALYRGDAVEVLGSLPDSTVDCVVTSPPYYGQRDYGVEGQIGLEPVPQEYITKLVTVFEEAKRVLKPTGSLWVNLGDTYWSGKGTPKGKDPKQKHRRFTRPQDKTGPKPLCVPKQLLLIPHRFAIAMQDAGWIVRNDNVWYKVNPTPDPVRDRCASAHEYMFHFVLSSKYYFDYESVAVPSKGNRKVKAPPSVWRIKLAPTFKKHIAVFPEDLVSLPIKSTLPKGGVLLDPFCGSGTALRYALQNVSPATVIGIDISEASLREARSLLVIE